ncbi:uncharacterized protein TEOVI_000661400 [Trypanosoma equiperdum]|uniref:Uncharacterized protein n=1 Tax=Trypanosoma equiperdum TaxID=5694 RepID=A0A1G4I220_TRYEQ|nr:hypothetical protein, conserved [Trypanosoma equiperdum]
MEVSADTQALSEAMMIRLIEEQIWCGYEDVETAVNASCEGENVTYLRENVFPTLVPALYELVKRQQQCALEPDEVSHRYGPTGNTHPISWLSQYLLRNNTRHSKKICGHPYVMVNNELLRKEKGTRTKES